jgi:molecular chaperone HtpG
MMDEKFAVSKPIMEVNPDAPLVASLCGLDESQDEFIKLCGQQLFDNALLLEGVLPPSKEMAGRMQQFMEEAARNRNPG